MIVSNVLILSTLVLHTRDFLRNCDNAFVDKESFRDMFRKR